MLLRLKELRLINRIKQNKLSKILNITTATYNRYEKGIICPSIDKLAILADFYNVSLDYLLMRTTDSVIKNNDRAHNSLIHKYELLDQRGRKAVDTILEHEYQSTVKERCASLGGKPIGAPKNKRLHPLARDQD